MKRTSTLMLMCVLFAGRDAICQQPGSSAPAPATTLAPSAMPAPAGEQQGAAKLTNADVMEMAALGLSDEVIIDKIYASSATAFDTSLTGLRALKAAKISDAVIRVMINPQPVPGPGAVDVNGNPIAAGAPVPPPVAVQPPAPVVSAPPPPAPAPIVPFHSADGKQRLYVTDRPLKEVVAVARGDAAVVSKQAGDDPRTVEIQADVLKVCPAYVMVSNNPDRADYILVFRRQGGKRTAFFAFGGLAGLALAAGAKVDGASLFRPDGDMVYATKENTVGKSIRDVCGHIPAPGLQPGGSAPPPPQ